MADDAASVSFHVECGLTKPGERVFVVGSLPELGAWDPAGALACNTSEETFPIWSSAEQLLSLQGQDSVKLEFKLLVQNGKNQKWEPGPNRLLRLPARSGHIDATMAWGDSWVKTERSAAEEKADAEHALEQLAIAQKHEAQYLAALKAAGQKTTAEGQKAEQMAAVQKQKAERQLSIEKAEEQKKVAEQREANWRKKAAQTKSPAFVDQGASNLPDITLSCIGRHKHWDPKECAVLNVKEWQDATESYCEHYGKFGLVIPKHIHQIWIGPKEPPCVWLDTWRVSFSSLNPGWDYTLWTDEQVQKLQMENRELYDSEQMWQCKADILRLEILWRYGGIYIDADMVSVKSRAIDELIERSKETGWSIAYEPDTKDKPISVLGNSVICCTPFHPLTMMLIKYLKATFVPLRGKLQVFQVTGPVMYTKCLTAMSYTMLPQELLYPAFHFVPNPSSINFDRFPKALMFQFGYTCSGLEGWVKKNNCCHYSKCPYHSPTKYEPGPSRVLRLSTHGIIVEATMTWGDHDTTRILATGRLVGKTQGSRMNGYVAKQQLVSVKFHVECNMTKPGERVFVVGSLPELGAWDPAGALACNTSEETFPIWSSAEQILSLQGQDEVMIEYKVLLQSDESAEMKQGAPAPQCKSEWSDKSAEMKKGALAPHCEVEGQDADSVAELWSEVKKQWAEHLEAMKAEDDDTGLALEAMGA